ncbi:hypothetical protein EVJ58_g9195 [Rhodofomes roseus]|uniref:Uncharacterized protein n=1 Tax=Rhodofomes roseus TaxID=34475 RepID=A0A4Y9XUX6_9APHY|nr:hypothetical protein EVJ58_g9195 [Rhodofomes roseus]
MLPKRSLTGVLCKDGTLYFIALTILNALALIMYFTSPPDSVSDFLVPATTIAASRLMLSMRAAVYEPGSVSEPGTLVFARRFDHSGQSETQHARFPEFAGQFELEDLRAPAATTPEDANDDELMQRDNEIVEAPLQ